MSKIDFVGSVDIYSISNETYIRSGKSGKVGCLNDLSRDEYFSYSLIVKNNGEDKFFLN